MLAGRRKVVILLLRVVVFITVSPVMAVCRVAFRLRQRAARCRRRPHLNLTEKPEPPLRWASGRGQRTDGDRHGGQPDHAATRPNEAADRTSARPRERARGGMAGEGGLHAPLAGPNEAPAAGEGAGGLRGGLEEVGEGGHGYTWKRDNWRAAATGRAATARARTGGTGRPEAARAAARWRRARARWRASRAERRGGQNGAGAGTGMGLEQEPAPTGQGNPRGAAGRGGEGGGANPEGHTSAAGERREGRHDHEAD